MPTMHPALWRGCQIIKRCYELVPALTKLLIKLWERALDSAKAGSHLPPTQLGWGFRPLFAHSEDPSTSSALLPSQAFPSYCPPACPHKRIILFMFGAFFCMSLKFLSMTMSQVPPFPPPSFSVHCSGG